ncbi:MAG: 3-keto-5-aminohexanoate cleavage protein [Anaerolineales bacterium]|jgi:3-keto-5-aminohexanoate cleavage enzyme
MQPLIIIATPNICWLKPDVDFPHSAAAIAEEARLCAQNGATILHTHAEGKWKETIEAVRGRSDIIIQCGMSSLTIHDRMEVFTCKADMISAILNHHDEAFTQSECNILHLREEMAEYCRLCTQYGVIPEWEIWHTGSIWNLNYLIGKRLLKPPYVTTLFFGWPGGTWSPPTVEEYYYRRKLMPVGSICNVSTMGNGQRDILAAAITNGDHVRVGTEDLPYDHLGNLAPTHELVHETAEMARALGRPLATVDQARKLIGL